MGIEHEKKEGQSSLTTIFSIVSTMLGATLLSVPWAFSKSGLIGGVVLVVFLGALTCYTASLIIRNGKGCLDFADRCRNVLGGWAFYSAQVVSVVVLFGALISYHIILSANLFDVVEAFRFFCGDVDAQGHLRPSWFTTQIFPLFILAVVFPLTLVRELKVLVKLSSFGIFSVIFITVVIIYSGATPPGGVQWVTVTFLSGELPETIGVLSLAFFVHNLVLAFFRNARNRSSSPRDLAAAFAINALIYGMVGAVGYAGFHNYVGRDGREGILDNFLQMLQQTSGLAIAARVALIIQMVICFPLLFKMMRLNFLVLVLPTRFMKNGAAVAAASAALEARRQREQEAPSGGYGGGGDGGDGGAESVEDDATEALTKLTLCPDHPQPDPPRDADGDSRRPFALPGAAPAPPVSITPSSEADGSINSTAEEGSQGDVGVQSVAALDNLVVPEPEFSMWTQVLPATILFFTATTSFAVWYPNIGQVLRFSGAFCGLVYIYGLPVLVEMVQRTKRHRLCVAEWRLRHSSGRGVEAGVRSNDTPSTEVGEDMPLLLAQQAATGAGSLWVENTRFTLHLAAHGAILAFGLAALFLQFFF